MRSIVHSLFAALLLAGCAGAQHASATAAAASSPAVGAGGLSIATTRTRGASLAATATAPLEWAQSDALSRGDDLAALVDTLRARHATGPLRVEVRVNGKVVAVAESPKRGRVTFSMRK
ncbi:MAG: hypothetical protein KGM44_01030 [bacterium]|nr:hypothetical protein [bacterium]